MLGDCDLLIERGLVTRDAIEIEHHALAVPSVAGTLDSVNGRYVLDLLDAAIDGAVAGRFNAIVTAPLQKSTINDAGIPFTGHTEYLAERTHTPRVVMMLAGSSEKPLRVALATTHLPLKDVSAALSIDGLVETLRIIDHDLQAHFGLARPRILVTGLQIRMRAKTAIWAARKLMSSRPRSNVRAHSVSMRPVRIPPTRFFSRVT